MRNEFDVMFKALFSEHSQHEAIIRALAEKRRGLTRKELLEKLDISTGGRVDLWLQDLEQCGFISQIPFVEGKKKTTYYRVIDEFLLFHLRWIEGAGKGVLADDHDHFLLQKSTQAYESWSGFAFENVVFQHLKQVKAALGLQKISVEAAVWQKKVAKLEKDKGVFSVECGSSFRK
ncbi:hypothetical protein [Oligoflexus tunisiensis]|uniref:hypothetical protein n=1 Tax=Oligoflexus tunisiensis TaxID=708132 RepID=UPI001C406967|nr:hypothetical protein [Oligoflexus tunisiensis]